jgi:PAS domain S-box-containing protein
MLDLENIVELSRSPAFFFDVESKEILVANSHFASLMGYEKSELLTMNVYQLRPPEDAAKLDRALKQQPPEGAVEWRYKTRTGEILYVQITYRDSVYMDKQAKRSRNVRLVLISSWNKNSLKSADDLFG